ncbi:MAG: hypothetical protein AMXMBFR12_00810 [Candidatus Babeliales bacterium]
MIFGKPLPPHVILEEKLDEVIARLEKLEKLVRKLQTAEYQELEDKAEVAKEKPHHILLSEKLDLILKKLNRDF